jgi:hypothetical protein
MIQPDPEYQLAAARAERDGLASCLGRVQLQLSETLEFNHALKRDLAQAQIRLAELEAKAKPKPRASKGKEG